MNDLVVQLSSPVWDWLTKVTWQSGVLLAGVVALLLVFGKIISPKWRCFLWLMIFVRLILPFEPQSKFSIYSLFTEPMNAPAMVQPQSGLITKISYEMPQQLAQQSRKVQQIEQAPVVMAASAGSMDWKIILLGVWAVGAIISWGWMIVSQLRFTRSLRLAIPVTGEMAELFEACCRRSGLIKFPKLLTTDRVSGPSVYGIRRPAVLLPESVLTEMTQDQLRFVFLHEIAHVQRRDTLIEAIASIVRAMHWFNPVVYLVMNRFRTERELACDELVLRQTTNSSDRTAYGHTVLFVASRAVSSASYALPMASRNTSIKRRIHMISSFKVRKFSYLLPVLLIIILASCTMTGAQSDEKPSSDASGSKAEKKFDYSYSKNQLAQATASDASSTTPRKLLTKVRDEAPVLLLADDQSSGKAVTIKPRAGKDAGPLSQKVPEIRFDQVAFSDTISFLRDTGKLNIYVNWKALEAAGIDRNTPITMSVVNVTYAKTLQLVLTEAGGKTLGYSIDDGVITISTVEDLGSATVTKAYDIRDLLAGVQELPKSTDHANPSTQPAGVSELSDQIISLITDTVDTNSWKANGGNLGSIRYLSGQLIITQSAENLEQIEALLKLLRDGRSLQVSVTSHIITLDPKILPAGEMRDQITNLLNGMPTNQVGKEKTSWYLSEKDVETILAAIKDQKGASVISSPRLTLFNGQNAMVFVGSQTPYISDQTAIAPDGEAKRWKPVITQIDTGLKMEVQATVSADRKNVTLNLKPSFSRLDKIENQPFKPADGSDAQGATIQKPLISSNELQTVVSVPDNGTLLLGGMKMPVDVDGKLTSPQPTFILIRPTIIQQNAIDKAAETQPPMRTTEF